MNAAGAIAAAEKEPGMIQEEIGKVTYIVQVDTALSQLEIKIYFVQICNFTK